MDILSNREWAIVFWFVIAVCYLVLSTKMTGGRTAFKNVVKAFFKWNILKIVCLLAIYIFLITQLLAKLSLWDVKYLKLTLIWAFSFAFLSIFKIQESKSTDSYFKKVVFDHFKLMAVIEYVVGFYSFSLITEILMTPILVIVSAMYVMTERKDKHKSVHKFMELLLAMYVVVLLILTINSVYADYTTLINSDTFNELLIPFLLTILYLPFLFMLHVYMKYESIFVGVERFIKDEKVLKYAKTKAIKSFYWRTTLVDNWRKVVNLSSIETKDGVDESINKVLVLNKRKNNSKDVDADLGWSPYKANEFLSEFGLKTGFYNNYCGDDVWHSSSANVDLDEGELFPSSIAYFIEGNEHAVEKVTLKLYVMQQESFKASVDSFIRVSQKLFKRALNESMPESLVASMKNGNNYHIEIGRYSVALAKQHWPNHAFNGFDMKLSVSLVGVEIQ